MFAHTTEHERAKRCPRVRWRQFASGLTAADLLLRAQLNVEMATATAAWARVQLLSLHSMSSPTQPKTIDGRFGTVDHPADSSVDLGDPTADDPALSARLNAEVATASAAQARMELLSAKISADGVLRQWPDAVYLQMDHSDQRYEGLVPVAVLDADRQELDGDMELWMSSTAAPCARLDQQPER